MRRLVISLTVMLLGCGARSSIDPSYEVPASPPADPRTCIEQLADAPMPPRTPRKRDEAGRCVATAKLYLERVDEIYPYLVGRWMVCGRGREVLFDEMDGFEIRYDGSWRPLRYDDKGEVAYAGPVGAMFIATSGFSFTLVLSDPGSTKEHMLPVEVHEGGNSIELGVDRLARDTQPRAPSPDETYSCSLRGVWEVAGADTLVKLDGMGSFMGAYGPCSEMRFHGSYASSDFLFRIETSHGLNCTSERWAGYTLSWSGDCNSFTLYRGEDACTTRAIFGETITLVRKS